MSDGPHKSLPMRTAWKRAAEVADSGASPVSEVTPRLLNALSADWREEVPPSLLTEVRTYLQPEKQIQMFSDHYDPALLQLQHHAAGRPLALVLIECARQARESGMSGELALQEGAQRALAMHVQRGVRQVEEHYLRKSNGARSKHVRERFEAGAAACNLTSQARILTGLEAGPKTLRIRRRNGIDDGVAL